MAGKYLIKDEFKSPDEMVRANFLFYTDHIKELEKHVPPNYKYKRSAAVQKAISKYMEKKYELDEDDTKGPYKQMNVMITKDMHDFLREMAFDSRSTLSHILRRIIITFINRY